MAKVKKSNQFDVKEIFRTLRTNIEFMQFDNDLQVINLTSTTKNEGKSTVSLELAKMYATKYHKVLIVDCDLRNATVHKLIGSSNAQGLSNLLAKIREVDTIADSGFIRHYIANDKSFDLAYISAGSKVPNPTEVLSSKRFKLFIEKARAEFDYIIIDCPPIGFVADAVPVSTAADGTLYVVSAEENNKKAIRASLDSLIRNGVNVLGVILNKVDASAKRYGYGYGYGYYED